MAAAQTKDTKKTNIPGCTKKYKNKRKTKSRKQGTKTSKCGRTNQRKKSQYVKKTKKLNL